MTSLKQLREKDRDALLSTAIPFMEGFLPPGEPTTAMPGTIEKLAAMIVRRERGEAVQQAGDAMEPEKG
jgi:hypothetical protein